MNIPLGSLGRRLGELGKKDGHIVVYCRSGARSALAVEKLRETGFDAINLKGGILAWAEGSAVHRLRRRVRQHYTWKAIFQRDIKPLLDGEGAA